MKKTKNLSDVAIIATSLTEPNKDKSEKKEKKGKKKGKKIAITTTVKTEDGSSGTSYLQLIEKFKEQSVDNKTAITIPFSTSVKHFGNHLYVFPGMMNVEQKITKYSYDNGILKEVGSLQLPEKSNSFTSVILNKNKAYLSLWGLGPILIYNPETMTKIGEIDLSEYAVEDNNPEPACSIIRDELLFVPLNQMVGGYTPKPDRNYADVLIIDTKTDKVIKMITEKKSKISLPTRPIDPNTIFIDENKDIYIACIGAFGIMPNHKSGFLRIKEGETEFDTDYSWDITETTIKDEQYKASWIASTKYIGDGKVLGYVNIKEYEGTNPFLSISSVPVEFDLKNKTIKRIKEVPNSNNHSCWVSQYKDLMILSNYGETSGGFYSYDPKTGEVSNGPVITTTGNPIQLIDLNK